MSRPKSLPFSLEESHNPQVRRQFEAWRDRIEREAQGFLDEAARVLYEAGLKKEQVLTRHLRQRIDVARDIIRRPMRKDTMPLSWERKA